jgi:hypothetical protein
LSLQDLAQSHRSLIRFQAAALAVRREGENLGPAFLVGNQIVGQQLIAGLE